MTLRIAFHANQLGLRGTEVAMYDYAHYSEALLLNESIVLAPRAGAHDAKAVQKFEARFPVFYYDTAAQREDILARERCAALYCIKSGANDGVVSRVAKTLVHCVFDMTQPHGDVYAGVSEYLAHASGGRFPFVPHLVSLPDIRDNLRAHLGIPDTAIVFGRHGGFDTFDLDWARAVVDRVAAERPDIFFVFLGTQPFCDRHNVLFLDATADLPEKVRFINSCDAMLHARADGETFGLACAEFSIRNKPVLTWTGGRAASHLDILGDRAIRYSDAAALYRVLTTFRPLPDGDWDAYTACFNSLTVMKTFERVFLEPLGLGAAVDTVHCVQVEHRGRRYSLIENDTLSRNLLRGEDWEPHVTACMTRLLRPGDYVIDVGASFGFHTLTAARLVARTGRVLAFEPQLPVFRLLYQNCVDNGAGNVKLFHLAVADQRGVANLNVIDYESEGVNLGDAFISPQGSEGERVMAVSLDDLPIDQPIRLIKIDVQGAERFVLEGGARLIKADRPFLIVEFEDHCLRRYGYAAPALFDLIRSMDYSIFFLEYRYPSDHLCVPHERLAEFRADFIGMIHPHTASNVLNANLENGVTEKVVFAEEGRSDASPPRRLSSPASAPLHGSDKSYWHRYLDFYEKALSTLGRVSTILEFGVFKGDSIRWLAERFPEALIVGCDIVPRQESWPMSPRIVYARVDQSSVDQIRSLFSRLDARFDLVIEDGSHLPVHQRNCLVESMCHLRPGGMYVLEDIHTSHPGHPMYRALQQPAIVGPLHVLLAMEHLKSIGADLDEDTLDQLTSNSLFSRADIELIFERTGTIDLYRRATLPRRCYKCGTSNFDYASLRCRCGTSLYEEADSMSAVLRLAGDGDESPIVRTVRL